MDNIIDGHLVNFQDAQDLLEYEDYNELGGAMIDLKENDVYHFDLATEVWCY